MVSMLRNFRQLAGLCGMIWWCGAMAASGFNGHLVEEGPLQLEIMEFPAPERAGEPVEVRAVLRNRGDKEIACELDLHGLVDEWRPVAEDTAPIRVKPGGEAGHVFRITADQGVEQALYPVHVTAWDEPSGLNLHAVRIFESKIPKPGASARAGRLLVPVGGVVRLAEAKNSTVVWELADGKRGGRPAGWTGSDEQTGTSRSVQEIDRGGLKRSIVVHPPWRNCKGVMRCEIPVQLPVEGPLVLDYSTAVRDPDPNGNTGDGITFRVRVDGEQVAQRHHGSRTWIEDKVDLAKWAGKAVTIALETDPGPRMDTTFDQGYWGDPVIRSGPEPRVATVGEINALQGRVLELLGGGGGDEDVVIELGSGGRVAVAPGPNGVVDGVIGLAMEGKTVRFRGLEVAVWKSRLGERNSEKRIERVEVKKNANGGWCFEHHCRDKEGEFVLRITLWAEGDGLRMKADCPRWITRLALGPADQNAKRVYGGHGYVIEEPEAFRMGFGGHSLAASHVAADFDGGLTVLTASDHPPVAWEVDPAQRRYSLVTRYDATLTLVPGVAGGLEAALRYRPLYDKPAAPGVSAKAGRFVFDIWGGRYAELEELMRGAVDYGLTDSMLTVHVWQRWGYDYRLPDIFPPAPGMGTLEEMKGLSKYCRDAEIPWGLHDNYIDFYPDAEDYTYDRICFHEGGTPVKAWINRGRDAQSYRWRPDSFAPFLKRNLRLIVPAVEPTHSFVDVFTSIPPVEFSGRDGEFHSALETRKHWNECFDTIRDALLGPAITTSEAGHDQLTGHLDGADCQFLELSPEPKKHVIPLRCGDWERVPWFDAVLHDRFSLHGVGYSSRYQNMRERSRHGIESDDYISAEMLTGHALMIDRGGWLRGGVRKYWLAQAVARALAMDVIEEAGWVDGDLHRQQVKWSKGMMVKVNRGSDDWTVDGVVLPEFGYVASDGKVRSAIEKIGGRMVERSSWPGGYYVNSRTQSPPGSPWPITPRAGEFESLEGRTFRLPIRWSVGWAPDVDANVFVHVIADAAEEDVAEEIVGQGDHRPEVPTSKWSGEVVTGSKNVVRLREDLPAGEYPLVVGLFTKSARLTLLGESAGGGRYRLGTVRLAEDGEVSFEAGSFESPKVVGNPPGTVVDFGVAATDGAFRALLGEQEITVTPLPGAKPMNVELRLPDGWPKDGGWKVVVLGRDGKAGGELAAEADGGKVVFRTRDGEFGYRVGRTER